MLDSKGREVPDPRPLAVPIGVTRPESLHDQIRRLVRLASLEAGQEGNETFGESDDFEVGDDYDPSSPWELSADQEAHREERRQSWEENAAKAGWAPPKGPTWEEQARAAGWQAPAGASSGAVLNPPKAEPASAAG